MTIDEKLSLLTDNLLSLHESVKTLATAVAAHDDKIEAHDRQIEGLIQIAEKHAAETAELRKAIAAVERQWQAYINTLPKN